MRWQMSWLLLRASPCQAPPTGYAPEACSFRDENDGYNPDQERRRPCASHRLQLLHRFLSERMVSRKRHAFPLVRLQPPAGCAWNAEYKGQQLEYWSLSVTP